MKGTMRGSFGTVGGVTRTFGLHRHFDRPEAEEKLPRPTFAAVRRISRYFRPYWKQWVVILSCVGIASGLSVLPPFCVRWILDHALPEKDHVALVWLSLAMVGLAVASGLIGVLQQTLTARAGRTCCSTCAITSTATCSR
jgi:ABC-type bacteriocin/lantibiotic exporter with double-glycine peptidase domain